MSLIKTNRSLVTGNKGQVALFFALTFQILFLFFAMIVNVGLVVHHKINLQNSADMAAYYGAMKQAELLNSIGHINYQMRQSWKLLAWRYRILGTAGDTNFHPYNFTSKTIDPNKDLEFSPPVNSSQGNFASPPFCISYYPFNDDAMIPKNESTCKETLAPDIYQKVIRLFRPPGVAAPFIGLAVATNALTINLKDSALRRCAIVGPFNYIMLGSFAIAYQFDQYARRTALTKIARSMSSNDKDFDDIDGKSVKAGAEETFKRNLTYANKEGTGYSFEMLNSLALSDCGNGGGDDEMAPNWLAEIRVFPNLFYMDIDNCSDNNTDRLGFTPKSFDLIDSGNVDNPANKVAMPFSYWDGRLDSQPAIKARIRYVAQSLSLYNDKYRFISGYEKNPWCQAYVGVKAATKPKIPFAPSDLTLTASAFAKPFGGKIGPWYYKNWDRSSRESTGSINDRTDMQLSLRIKDAAMLGSDPSLFGNPLRIPNFSRFVGDMFGISSWRYMAHQARAFYQIPPDSDYRSVTTAITATDQKILARDAYAAPRLEDWNNVAMPFNINREKDILAWNFADNKEPGMRMLELQAIAPDQFDIAYYSIDPNYYANYYKKLQSGLLRKLGFDDTLFRSDIGSRMGDQNLEKFSVKDQIKTAKDISASILDFATKMTHTVLNPVHLLTSWSNKSLFDYEKPVNEYFGNCLAPKIDKANYIDPQTNTSFLTQGESVPGECITGGRTGYSVKIISKDSLFSSVKPGGEAGGEGAIKNPPTGF